MTFEKAMERLDEIVAALSKGDVTLDESLSLYAEGAKLVEQCENQLTQAKVKIEQLMPAKDGQA